jgi:predicted enzyme related to lactoylglutathione lyase
MINGAHVIVYAEDADKVRAFFRDVLELDHVDVGGGWLIMALPPAEVAAHPADDEAPNGHHELFLMCENVETTRTALERKGIEFTMPIMDQPWGRITRLKIPGGGEMGLYEPKHERPQH